MWKQIFEFIRGVVFVTRDLAEVRSELKQLRQEFDEVQRALNTLAHTIELMSERERLEREKLIFNSTTPFCALNAACLSRKKERGIEF